MIITDNPLLYLKLLTVPALSVAMLSSLFTVTTHVWVIHQSENSADQIQSNASNCSYRDQEQTTHCKMKFILPV